MSAVSLVIIAFFRFAIFLFLRSENRRFMKLGAKWIDEIASFPRANLAFGDNATSIALALTEAIRRDVLN